LVRFLSAARRMTTCPSWSGGMPRSWSKAHRESIWSPARPHKFRVYSDSRRRGSDIGMTAMILRHEPRPIAPWGLGPCPDGGAANCRLQRFGDGRPSRRDACASGLSRPRHHPCAFDAAGNVGERARDQLPLCKGQHHGAPILKRRR
jgi:hypothetical protein